MNIKLNDEMIYVCIYCDTTPLFTEEEMDRDNLCELSFPRDMVREYYESDKNTFDDETMAELKIQRDECNFEKWITSVYTADSTVGLFDFCKSRGFIAVREEA